MQKEGKIAKLHVGALFEGECIVMSHYQEKKKMSTKRHKVLNNLSITTCFAWNLLHDMQVWEKSVKHFHLLSQPVCKMVSALVQWRTKITLFDHNYMSLLKFVCLMNLTKTCF